MLLRRLFLGGLISSVLACSATDQGEASNPTDAAEEVTIVLAPSEIVIGFIDDLGRKDFQTAWSRTNGQRWGNAQAFSSPNAFGSIYKTEIHDLKEMSNDGTNAVVYADASYYSSLKDYRYQEDFYLQRIKGEWKIVRFKIRQELPLRAD